MPGSTKEYPKPDETFLSPKYKNGTVGQPFSQLTLSPNYKPYIPESVGQTGLQIESLIEP